MPECLVGQCTSARHAGSFDCLMTSLILITMDNGRGHCAYWQPAKFQPKPTEEWKKNRKMYAIKQIKICAEYRDMLPRPRLDLSGTPGLRTIGLSPGSWQTSLGLGSMSRYSAHILSCIIEYGLAVWRVRRAKCFAIYYTRSLQGNLRIWQGTVREFSGGKFCIIQLHSMACFRKCLP